MPTENSPLEDEQTEKRIHEHLRNEGDLISEEDLNNVKTSIDQEGSKDLINDGEKYRDKAQDIAKDEEKKNEGEDPRIETSWNILS